MKQAIDDRIYRIVSDVFGAPTDTIDDDSSPDSISTWDSISHIHLILALESEFGVELSPEDSMEMLSVRLIRMILEDCGIDITS